MVNAAPSPADFWRSLPPEDAIECQRDLLAWGSAWARIGSDGVKHRIPPSDWEDKLGVTPPDGTERVSHADSFWWRTPEEWIR
jgi:hypothetical protein